MTDWRELVLEAASDPNLTKDRAELEILRVGLGMAGENMVNLAQLAMLLQSHGAVKKAGGDEGGSVGDLVAALNDAPSPPTPPPKKKPKT